MAKTIYSNMDEQLLASQSKAADRFVYSRFFVPCQIRLNDGKTPALDIPSKAALKGLFMRDWDLYERLLAKKTFGGLTPIDVIMEKNGLRLMKPKPLPEPGPDSDPAEGFAHAVKMLGSEYQHLLEQVAEFRGLTAATASSQPGSELIRLKQAEISSSLFRLRAITDKLPQVTEIGRVLPEPSSFLYPVYDILIPLHDMDAILQMMKSNIGFLFLDRTRIRPSGFAIGEHVYALSLAPGEEVVLEQKTFTKRQETLEDEKQLEQEFNFEMSSTLTTELQEGMQRQQSISETLGMTVGGNVSAPIQGATVGESVGGSDNITSADALTTSSSLKQSHVTSSKVAAKYRSLHKTTFKLTTEQGFESTSKRVIRNPNKFAPVTLHYFKILQTLDIRHERYGVRLAWTPCVSDPGYDVDARIIAGRQQIVADAIANAPIPTEPHQPPILGRSPKSIECEKEVTRWSLQWGARGGYSGDLYVGPMTCPDGYQWDNDIQAVRNSVTFEHGNDLTRKFHFEVVRDPWWNGNDLYITVHVGIEDGRSPTDRPSFKLKSNARFLPKPAEQELADQAKLQDWQEKHDAWATEKAAVIASARSDATGVADKWAADQLEKLNTVAEIMGRIVTQLFPAEMRGECWQIDLWQKIFDWGTASCLLYPSWWTRQTLRDPTRSPTDFMNASFAKIYLPVRPGFEHLALRYIYGGVVDTPLSPEFEAQFTKVEDDLNTYRKENFGEDELNFNKGPSGHPMTEDDDDDECSEVSEKFLCLGKWKETLPTDGTHLEIVLGMTSAADDISKAQADTLARQAAAVADNISQDVEIKKKVLTTIQAPTTDVTVTVNSSPAAGG